VRANGNNRANARGENIMTEEFSETKAFIHADRRISQLLETLKEKKLCGCCVARALSYNAAAVAENSMGSTNAAEMFEGLAMSLRQNNKPYPGLTYDDPIH
jgi:hypothetical protein